MKRLILAVTCLNLAFAAASCMADTENNSSTGGNTGKEEAGSNSGTVPTAAGETGKKTDENPEDSKAVNFTSSLNDLMAEIKAEKDFLQEEAKISAQEGREANKIDEEIPNKPDLSEDTFPDD